MKPSSILVATHQDAAFIRPIGRATFESAADFKAAFGAMRERGFRRFIVDLAECAQMDSTFLGTLAASAMKLREQRGTDLPIHLCGPNERIVKLLGDLGVIDLFRISRTEPTPSDYRDAPGADASPRTMAQTSLEAHETLIALCPENRPKFKDVVTFLKEDLGKIAPEKAAGETPGA
jgi:anti-anti-sigma regulatory factor